MAAEWSFYLHDTILNTDSGTGQITELSAATGRGMGYSLTEGATLSFSMPGSHWQTEVVIPGLVDVIAYYGQDPIQRFLVNQRTISKTQGRITCSFSAVSYRSLLDRWLIHDAATRDFTNVEQTAIAWTLISQAEARAGEQWNLTRGTLPTINVNRDRLGSAEPGQSAHGYDAGAVVGEMVANLAQVEAGFEYDIEPSPITPQTALVFNTWNEGLRKQHAGVQSPFVLDDGGTMAAWSREDAMADYGNVVRAQGRAPTGENAVDAVGPVAWRPNPPSTSPASPYGRWERAESADATLQAALNEHADGALARWSDPASAWSATLAPGRWSPDDLWLGDYARVLVSEAPMDDVDELMRVQQIDVALDDNGVQVVTVGLGRPPASYAAFRQALARQLAALRRR
jgi:hypothetical protein